MTNDMIRMFVRSILLEDVSGLSLFHGGLPADATLESIDLNRPGTQQNKAGRSYGGFYLADKSSLGWAQDYARKRGGILHRFDIAASARILRTDAVIDRLSKQQRDAYAQEYDLITGPDVLGRRQWVLLNRDVVTRMERVNVDDPGL